MATTKQEQAFCVYEFDQTIIVVNVQWNWSAERILLIGLAMLVWWGNLRQLGVCVPRQIRAVHRPLDGHCKTTGEDTGEMRIAA